MWNCMWDGTVADLADEPALSAGRFAEPRLEPEMLGIGSGR